LKKASLLVLLFFGILLPEGNNLPAQSSAGIQLGTLQMSGEVSTETQLLNSLGFSIQNKLSHKSNLSILVSRSRTSGFEYTYWSHVDNGGGLEGKPFESFKDGDKWFPNYVLNATSLRISYEYAPFNGMDNGFRKKITPYIFGGIGISHFSSYINIKDETGQQYKINEEDRILSINEIKNKFDDTYETSLFDANGTYPMVGIGLGLNYYFSDIWNLLFSIERISAFTDKLDGIRLMNDGTPSNNQDILYLYQFEIRRNF
jgi:hypothetical protein